MWQFPRASSRGMRFPSRSHVRSRGTRSPPNIMGRSAVIRSRAKWKLAGTARPRVIGKPNAKQKRNRRPQGSPRRKEAVATKAGEKLWVVFWGDGFGVDYRGVSWTGYTLRVR